MNDSSNEIVKQLIRLANDRNLDAGSRNKICDMAQHVRDLQNLLNKTRELNIKLEKFKCANKLNQINWFLQAAIFQTEYRDPDSRIDSHLMSIDIDPLIFLIRD